MIILLIIALITFVKFISVGQFVDRSTGVWIIPISRRINEADGSFGGVALVTVRVNFFERIYNELDVGATGTVLLALNNGTLIYRRPFEDKIIGTDISRGPVMQTISRRGDGSAILTSRLIVSSVYTVIVVCPVFLSQSLLAGPKTSC